jgi:predicted acetyltransferase
MELIAPSRKYYDSYVNAIHEYNNHGVKTYAFMDIENGDIFEKFEDARIGRNLPENYVPATYFWLVDKDEFIGEISIRHRLTDSLLRFGGNVGYGIRYSKWNHGFGTAMLSMALVYAKEVLGVDKVLITCNDSNFGSARVIEKNGGLLRDKIINVIDGAERVTRRYWITM